MDERKICIAGISSLHPKIQDSLMQKKYSSFLKSAETINFTSRAPSVDKNKNIQQKRFINISKSIFYFSSAAKNIMK